MHKNILNRIALGAIPFGIFIAAWLLVTEAGLVRQVFLPTIPHVLTSLSTLFIEENYLVDVFVSIYRVMVAFLISGILAVPIGLFTGYYNRVAGSVEPFVGFARYLPVPAFVPLCILWFGLGDMGKIAVIFLGTFFQLILMITDVVRGIPKDFFQAALTLGASENHIIGKVLLPASLPGIVSASRIAVGWAWTYLVVAEIAGATSGIGFRIMEAQRFIQTPKIFAGIVVIGLLGITTDLLFRALHRFLFPWLDEA